MILLNAISANMLAEFPVSVTFTEISPADARAHLLAESSGEAEIRSAVGHAETAAVFSSVIGLPVPCRRETVVLARGESAIVGQYSGPRLPGGATSLPENATLRWLRVSVS